MPSGSEVRNSEEQSTDRNGEMLIRKFSELQPIARGAGVEWGWCDPREWLRWFGLLGSDEGAEDF